MKDCTTAKKLAKYFIKVVQSSTDDVQLSLEHTAAILEEFHEYSEDDVWKIIMSTQSKSCALSPILTKPNTDQSTEGVFL